MTDATPLSAPKSLGLAISGGGYRAAAWGIGTVLAIADLEAAPDGADRRPRVSMVSSVSGGSLANAQFGVDFDLSTETAGNVDVRACHLAPKLVGHRLWSYLGLLIAIVPHVFGPCLVAGAIDDAVVLWAGISGVAAAGAVTIGSLSRDLLFGWPPTWLYVAATPTMLHAIVALFRHDSPFAASCAICALVLLLWLRPSIVALAMDRHFTQLTGRRSPTLNDLSDTVTHIICATELNSGRHLYLANGAVHSHNWGTSTTADLRVSVAAQASSNMPFAFNVRALRNARMNLPGSEVNPKVPRRLPVTDGGVYDNMGSQWFTRLAERHAELSGGTAEQQSFAELIKPPDLVVIANASGLGRVKTDGMSLWPVVGFVKGLLRVTSILYEQTTAFRRSTIVHDFDDVTRGLDGTLVQITSDPTLFPVLRARAGQSDAARAQHALVRLNAIGGDWNAEATRNAGVATAFWPLARTRMATVMWHAYLQTAANLHIKYNTPLRVPPLDEFVALTGGTNREPSDYWS